MLSDIRLKSGSEIEKLSASNSWCSFSIVWQSDGFQNGISIVNFNGTIHLFELNEILEENGVSYLKISVQKYTTNNV